MTLKTIKDSSVEGKLVFVRCDFNVPLDDEQRITDDTRIRAALPTLTHLLERGARVICASHLGRPGGQRKRELSIKPVSLRLSQLLDRPVLFEGEVVGKRVATTRSGVKAGEILLLENLRFEPGETANDSDFARQLAEGVDIYVNDAFGACHRNHASVDNICQFVPEKAAGFLLEKEISRLSRALDDPPSRFTLVLGGAKVSDKIPVITNLMDKVSDILIGGAMAYTFLKAKGEPVGHSRIETEQLDLCRDILQTAAEKGVRFLLPVDHIAAIKIEPNVTIRMINEGKEIPEEMMGLDIGSDTVKLYAGVIGDADLVVWNGPMGVFEVPEFSAGTMEIARAVAESGAETIIGGGDTVAALNQAGLADRVTHISTGGGASLEFLSGKRLPGIAALELA